MKNSMVRYWTFGKEQKCVWVELFANDYGSTAHTWCGHLQTTQHFVNETLDSGYAKDAMTMPCVDVVEQDAAQKPCPKMASDVETLNAALAKRGAKPALVSSRVPDDGRHE